ncbi:MULTISPECIES: GvpL/GvpF family gas vesicle protein [Streptomyces]|uniref:GvpL/GvpF family gas vesicle protein n=1 Tax=Streptomyces TaxID=1883 RepID=UPI0003A02217|nr:MULTISPECIES: GvpL/GvpF family gas vesicle protein [Streptomyces]MBZ6113442.1 GvpL/GvpF family gas vesicle protein [Streptomyces olivaceus]MBZ6127155.1 GvpL/GvpF family gas vesicle protein [Streptomyces olivaceus]MBZ6148010.1 GvpL/GvpF family gas vesicle protein [Streptomyces olivaceus]MBZ6162041.1 GvpL/GvpF family gas vesicle protein [Streptomyces olivaceus]MBZ6189648.1 GvpL/GvpF family gas vesicle protein [Streptomyces olivaceus]
MTTLRYVYAVCRPFEAPLQAQLTGVSGDPPRLLPHGDLVAVVSHVPEADFSEQALRGHLEDLDWLTGTARAHQQVVDALTAVTTPLPLRLATVFRDDSGVRVMLEEREAAFGRTLDRLDGCVEWGVKVHVEAEPEPAAAPAAPGPKPASGRDYLRQRRQQSRARDDLWTRAEEFATGLHRSLSDTAEDARLHAPQDPRLSGAAGRNVLNAAYLVHRDVSEEFVESVDRRAKDDTPGIRVELTGPWAAYSFAGEEDAGEEDVKDKNPGEAP